MKIKLTDIPEEGLELRYDEDPENLGFTDKETRFNGVIAIHVRIERMGETIDIDGGINTSLTIGCGRCLKDFPYPINTDFRLEYNPMKEIEDPKKGEVYRINKADLETDFFDGDSIYLEDIIKEQIILSMPIAPLCRQDCKGLCSNCGEDLNMKGHRCISNEIDPRFSALQNFFRKGDINGQSKT